LKVLGIDAGFSKSRATSCYCGLQITGRLISFDREPTRFHADCDLSKHFAIANYSVITLDAPLTPRRISRRIQGRKIEKLFSQGVFSNTKKGPQPSSIAVPEQGWKLYHAGMDLMSKLKGRSYVTISGLQGVPRAGVYEVLPKMTQSLLVPPALVASRPKGQKIDDFLFPQLFDRKGTHRQKIDQLLGEFRFTKDVEDFISIISRDPKKYHEELAAVVCAFQAALIAMGRAELVGYGGVHEGYYALPPVECWDSDWRQPFEELANSEEFKKSLLIKRCPPAI